MLVLVLESARSLDLQPRSSSLQSLLRRGICLIIRQRYGSAGYNRQRGDKRLSTTMETNCLLFTADGGRVRARLDLPTFLGPDFLGRRYTLCKHPRQIAFLAVAFGRTGSSRRSVGVCSTPVALPS
jgi:hypothetical protein